jgi:hypothetical protein
VSPNQQELREVKTHREPALSFALAGGGGINARVERDGATGAAWLTILVDSCLFTLESIEA